MIRNDYKLHDQVVMKKPHPCHLSETFTIIRMGADIKIKCDGCGAVIMMTRHEFNRKLKKVVEKENGE